MTADEFVKMFRDWYYQVSRVDCGLLEREARKRENFIPCSPEEPTRRKRSREKRAKTSDTE